jgi:hypothetical protein
MEATLKVIFEYTSAILSLLVFLFTALMFVVNKIKKKHRRVEAEEDNEKLKEELAEEEARYKLVNELLPLAISKVEAIPLINGPTKKMLALSEVLLSCNALNIPFDKFKDFISEQLENLINFTKVVNKRDKDVINLPIEEKAE